MTYDARHLESPWPKQHQEPRRRLLLLDFDEAGTNVRFGEARTSGLERLHGSSCQSSTVRLGPCAG